MRCIVAAIACLAFAFTSASSAAAANPWADAVVSHDPGSNPELGFTDPNAAIGAPTRFTSPPPAQFGGVVTPLSSSFGPDESFSIGEGGSLVVCFDEPVIDHPLNPFGIDLLIFGNSFFIGDFFSPPDYAYNPAGTVSGVASEGGKIEVSADGDLFVSIAGEADGLFPTNAYADITEPFTTTPGLVPADFTRPVNPAFDPVGKNFTEIIAGYDGSGGGLGIDLASTGLKSISFVRITNPVGSGMVPEIDALADVSAIPEPSTLALAGVAALLAFGRRRRR